MELDEAKRVLNTETDASIGRLMLAAGVLCSRENSERVSLTELIDCLKRGHSFGRMNLVIEYAVLALYRKTCRPRKSNVPFEDFITDSSDWIRYLQEHGL